MKFPVFEAIMMICFGLAWPISIMKSWRSRTNKGKSGFFMFIVFVGYVSGLIHKIWWQDKIDGVVWLYALNIVMVMIDCVLFYRNGWLDLRADKQKAEKA